MIYYINHFLIWWVDTSLAGQGFWPLYAITHQSALYQDLSSETLTICEHSLHKSVVPELCLWVWWNSCAHYYSWNWACRLSTKWSIMYNIMISFVLSRSNLVLIWQTLEKLELAFRLRPHLIPSVITYPLCDFFKSHCRGATANSLWSCGTELSISRCIFLFHYWYGKH
jgi:hypothetical protein